MDIPKEILIMILFAVNAEYVSWYLLIQVCKRWCGLITDINTMINSITGGSLEARYSLTKLLEVNRVVPSVKSAKQIVSYWHADGQPVRFVDYFIRKFIRYYTPKGWRNLPMPTWEQIKSFASTLDFRIDETPHEYYGTVPDYHKKKTTSQFTSLLRLACSRPCSFKYLYDMIVSHGQDIANFSTHDLEFVAGSENIEFIDWFVRQPFSRMSPYGLRCLMDRTLLPFHSIREYVLMPVTHDWNGYDCCDEPLGSPRAEMFRAAYHGYEWLCFINPGICDAKAQPEWLVGLEYFYAKCRIEDVRSMICVAQNGMLSFEGKWSHTADERKRIFDVCDNLIEKYKHVHPVEQMHCYSWHRADKPYIREPRLSPDDHARLEEGARIKKETRAKKKAEKKAAKAEQEKAEGWHAVRRGR
jgi:hypothetical protein